MGADEAVLVKDDAPETYDGLRTARIIARAVERQASPGPTSCSSASSRSGADNGQVPAMVAELLGLPQATVVTKLEVDGGVGHGPPRDRRAAWRKSSCPCRPSSPPRRG